MKKIIVDPLTLTSVPIQICLRDKCIACGTAFVYVLNQQYYLITAGHNFTGTHPETNFNVGMPDLIRVFFQHSAAGNSYNCQSIKLYDEAGNKQWLQHPIHGASVDVVAIRFVPDENTKLFPINVIQFSEIPFRMGMDVFIIGFPHGYTTSPTIFPIWKRGSLASEYMIDVEGLPKVYIDTGTAKAMSGSPVIARHSGVYSPSGEFSGDSWFGSGDTFLGVYSGRLVGERKCKDDEKDSIYDVQLGIVWKKVVIDEILSQITTANIEPLSVISTQE